MIAIDHQIQKIATRQHGVVSRRQLRELRVQPAQISRRVQSGAWIRELPGVWRLSWAEPTSMARAWSASLWGGSQGLLSHWTAAWLWGLKETAPEMIELTVEGRCRRPPSWLRTYQIAAPFKALQRMRGGLAVTSPARTLVDLAAMLDDEGLRRMMEEAFRRRISSVAEVRRALRAAPPSGKAGTGKAAKTLELGTWNLERQSELERQALALFRRYRLPAPRCQYLILEDDVALGTVDFAWPKAKVIVEAEGFAFHSGREAWESDISRYNALVLHGWTVLRLTYGHLRDAPQAFVASLSKALGVPGARRSA